MPTTEFNKQKEALIDNIKTEITDGKELDSLINHFNKIMVRKAAKAQKALNASITPSYYARRVPSITSLDSNNNITHEEAMAELQKIVEVWK